jgi:hypothetical protein
MPDEQQRAKVNVSFRELAAQLRRGRSLAKQGLADDDGLMQSSLGLLTSICIIQQDAEMAGRLCQGLTVLGLLRVFRKQRIQIGRNRPPA